MNRSINAPLPGMYEFGEFRLDVEKRILSRNGTQVPLTARVFDTLLYLVTHSGELLEKERLMDAVWPDAVVEENNLTQNVSTLRRLFGDTPGSHRFIVTVPGRGYRFVAAVRATNKPANPAESSQPSLGEVSPVSDKTKLAPPRRTLRRPVYLVAALVLLAGAAFFFWRLRSSLPVASSLETPSLVAKSIAILPFENLSADPENAYLANGIQEEILTYLSQIADLKVISRTSANLYKTGAPRNVREIGLQLGVAHILEGSVQRADDRLRVHAQLIDTRSDSHLWAQTYERTVADIFALQSEIAQTIAERLQAKITEKEKAAVTRPATVDLVADNLYRQALAARFDFGRREAHLNAAALLEQAIERDPRFVRAYCELVRVHMFLYSDGYDHTPEHLRAVNALIEKAAEIQPDAGEVHLVRAHYLARGLRDYDRAREELELSRRALPNDPAVYTEIGLTDSRQGRWTESLRNLERAVELDPRNPSALLQVVGTCFAMKKYADGARFARRVVALSPRDYAARWFIANQANYERADIGPLVAELTAILADEPKASTEVAQDLFYCAMVKRDEAITNRALALIPPEGIPAAEGFVRPREWYVGFAARIYNRLDEARAAFSAARDILDRRLREHPDHALVWSFLGRVKAELGQKEEAIAAGRRGCDLLPLSQEPTSGLRPLKELAKIYAATGEKDLALDVLGAYGTRIFFTEYGDLKLNPEWDPLRGDPRFEKVVQSLAPK